MSDQYPQNDAEWQALFKRKAAQQARQQYDVLRQKLLQQMFADLLSGTDQQPRQYRQQMGGQPRWANEPLGYAPPIATPRWCKVLGLPQAATKDQIKAKYRSLVKIHHPDRGGSPTKFNQITEAYNEAMK